VAVGAWWGAFLYARAPSSVTVNSCCVGTDLTPGRVVVRRNLNVNMVMICHLENRELLR
jgi:hypothetical protein